MLSINKTQCVHKIILILAGIVVFFILLEFGLHLGGSLLLSIQEHWNIDSLKANKQYSIMCVGESTTALGGDNSYPAQIEKILNKKYPGLKIRVINKGVSAIDTSGILKQLDENLNKYKPNMVITMIGINDFNAHLSRINNPGKFLKYLKTYKLLRLVWLTITDKLSYVFCAKNLNQEKNCGYLNKFSEDSLKKAIKLNPTSDSAYLELANFYGYGERESEAKKLFKKAIELNSNNDYAYSGLGWCYRREGDLIKAEELFKKSLELNPKNEQAWIELGRYYYKQGKQKEAEKLFKIVLDSNSTNYINVGSFYISQGDFIRAEKVFKRAILTDSTNNKAYGALALLCWRTGRPEAAKRYYDKSRQLQLKYSNSLTSSNYNKIKEILDKRGIKLVCVQYPMRSIEPLIGMFIDRNGIIFVDNEKIFMESVRREGIKEYFWDMFAGDFGHCTSKGNKLLAQNIVDVLVNVGIFSNTTQ